MKLRIDYDNYAWRMSDTFYMLKSIPTPYNARISASGNGLHIYKEGDYTYDDPLYVAYDDPRRLRMNRIRQRAGVSHNLLWDVKNGKRPGPWVTINNIADVLTFMTHLGNTNDNYFAVTENRIYPLDNILNSVDMTLEVNI